MEEKRYKVYQRGEIIYADFGKGVGHALCLLLEVKGITVTLPLFLLSFLFMTMQKCLYENS
jgi:hypothetical protein